MSPEYASIMNVDRDLRREFEQAADKNTAQLFYDGGFFVRSAQRKTVYKPLGEATEAELETGRLMKSNAHIVYGPNSPSPTDLRRKKKDLRGNETLEDARLGETNGYTRKHRGKHRSHTKRKGAMAFFRKSISFFGYRR